MSGPGCPRRLTSLLPVVVVSGGRGVVVFFWEPTASHRKEISLHATHTKQNNQQKKTLKKKEKEYEQLFRANTHKCVAVMKVFCQA